MAATGASNGRFLTPAEETTLELVAHGHTYAEAAAIRFVSPETVKTQMYRIRWKLGAKNTAHAVYLAVERGYIR